MPRVPTAAPYPHDHWPSLPRAATGGAAALRGALSGCDMAGALDLAGQLLGCPLQLRFGAPTDCPGRPAQARGVPSAAGLEGQGVGDCLLLQLGLDRHAGRVPIALLLPLELAALLVDRVLGGDGATVHLPGDDLDELSLGALGYLAARVLATGGGGLRLEGLSPHGPADTLEPDAASPRLLWPATLTIDGRTFTLRALTPATLSGPPPVQTACWPPDLELGLCAHAGTVTLTRAQLDALQPGDALLPERCRLTRSDDGSFHGEVRLHVPGAQAAQWSCHAAGQQLRIERQQQQGGMAVTEGKRIEAAQRAGALAGDAPVEVCLELARFTLTLDELGRLAPGDVLSTGQPIGRHVVLRAGGVELGVGELVEVQGEVGVRLTALNSAQKLDGSPAEGD